MMTLWAKIVRQGSRGSQLVLSSCTALQTCTRGHSVNFSRQFNHVNKTTSPLFSSHLGPKFASTSVDINDGKVIDSTTTDEQTPIEWTGELDEFTLVLSDEQIQELSGGDPEIIKKIRYIQLEHEVYRQDGRMVPSMPIKMYRWVELLDVPSKHKRKKFYEMLYNIERTVELENEKRELRKLQRLEEYAQMAPLPALGEDPDGTIYGLNRNTLFLRLRDSTVNTFYHNRLAQEVIFGQPFVFDCDFGRYMSYHEAKNCSKQIEYAYSDNRFHRQPFNLVFCNADPNDPMMKCLEQRIPVLYNPDMPLTITPKSYLDIFPRERLVYLSPNAKDELDEIQEDDIYIMGCMMDKPSSEARPFSVVKAKKEGIRTVKIPLDKYLEWGYGAKCLTLNQIMLIMLDQRLYNDWTKSLLHVPRRKIRGWWNREFREEELHDNLKSVTREDRKYGTYVRTGFHSLGAREQDDDGSLNHRRKYRNSSNKSSSEESTKNIYNIYDTALINRARLLEDNYRRRETDDEIKKNYSRAGYRLTSNYKDST